MLLQYEIPPYLQATNRTKSRTIENRVALWPNSVQETAQRAKRVSLQDCLQKVRCFYVFYVHVVYPLLLIG